MKQHYLANMIKLLSISVISYRASLSCVLYQAAGPRNVRTVTECLACPVTFRVSWQAGDVKFRQLCIRHYRSAFLRMPVSAHVRGKRQVSQAGRRLSSGLFHYRKSRLQLTSGLPRTVPSFSSGPAPPALHASPSSDPFASPSSAQFTPHRQVFPLPSRRPV
jgi:hypothetical protein